MYEYLIGTITQVFPAYIVVENNGIGYLINVANPFRFKSDETKKEKIYLHQIVRENEIVLYGFSDFNEKQLFLKLISVSGIGPKSALAILANEDHNGFVSAVNNDDDAYLTKFPGIGKKTAKQIILDLKGKLGGLESGKPLKGQQDLEIVAEQTSPYLKEALEALLALGYTKTEVKKTGRKLLDFKGDSTDEYLRQALRLMMNK
ncbi:Holliday junction branch migration protein RuvA [Ligilactobacillus ruminis]|uniref:Holliday junction branch migration complex subunit RuvA n=3 Tax=Ligilactobacillus ruminis TaxID=1623 RepID=G2SQM7_LIGR2|nr:Holliday junction branch migration protein RuvA [Ligilactobacillus ruminis]AEN78674.1 Holliday junction DNA helicase RuvA [Ligilactobacillus ruminis ATCC 27782]KLA45111.1 crossover junction ATP-dependent DNA helicase RuvA [Ligilactobacillus ruminis]KRM83046.1 crossover junction ATP-dependent DNA helicase RuvA [Ligilactobacillus ruminis DSM 20403 = NBRC 102161]MCF2544810.1 Holliday junction branch migration protein RuvA [Ligilactobacillus ruminis]MDD6172314.1 Holliday junction branch migrati